MCGPFLRRRFFFRSVRSYPKGKYALFQTTVERCVMVIICTRSARDFARSSSRCKATEARRVSQSRPGLGKTAFQPAKSRRFRKHRDISRVLSSLREEAHETSICSVSALKALTTARGPLTPYLFGEFRQDVCGSSIVRIFFSGAIPIRIKPCAQT